MTKIREIVKINSGYTSYVDLYEEYYDLVKNRGRMERYKPIAAHRQVFETIAKALNPLDRRCYFLSGSYGTGKSHLLLMLANYFANPSDVPEIEAFFRNYEAAQNEVLLKPGEILRERKAASLKEARQSGRFLVAVCRYSLNLDFEGAVLRALEEALQKEDAEILLDTHYREAVRRIADWEARRAESRFYTDLESAINRYYPDWTINKLVEALKSFDEQALKAFKDCFRKVTDTEFSFRRDNLRDIITDFLANAEFKARYKGIVLLYDEFGATIDANLVNYSTFLDFAQFCANSTLEKGGTVLFVGAGHKAFRNHGQIGDLNAETLEARVTEIGLQTQGMEDIIAAIVQPDRNAVEWNQIVQAQSGKFTWFSSQCNRLSMFNWLPAPKIKNNIIQNIYPMHPLATFALLRLANEAGSDNRSVFKFFAPEFETGESGWLNVQPCSYPWFLENHAITENNKLALYTADLLVDYFKDSLKATNNRLVSTVQTAVSNYEATLRELYAYVARQAQKHLDDGIDELMLRIIKVMLVNEIASLKDVTIANTVENIEFALDYVSPQEKTLIEDRLQQLCAAGVLYNNKGVYELMRGDRKDVQRLVDQYRSNPDNRPTNLLKSFLDANPLRSDEAYLEARDYNAQYSEDKRLKVVFATPAMLAERKEVQGVSLSYFAALEQERQQVSSAAYGYEGVAVYVFCEDDPDLDAARRHVAQNDQPRLVAAIPRTPIAVFDAIFTLKAFESDWYQKQAQDFGPFEKAEEKRIRDEAVRKLAAAKNDYFSNARVQWFGLRGSELPVPENKRHAVADRVMLELYGTKRNTFPHNEFNKTHLNLSGQVRAIFKEAGDILCNLSQPLYVNWSWPDNRGGTKYLRKCFIDLQALRVTHTAGDERYLEPEKDLHKFRSALPAYAKMLEDLAALEKKGQVNLKQFLKPYFEEYGQGDIAVTLFLLLARRYYGDSLRFKRDANLLTDIQFTSAEDVLFLVQGQSPNAVALFEPVSTADQAYFARVTQLFTDQPAPAGKIYTVSEAYQALLHWWNSLPVIARSLGFYPAAERPLAEAFSQARIKDPFQFIKHDLLKLLGVESNEVLTPARLSPLEESLQTFKSFAEAIRANIEEQILQQVALVFEASSHLDVDIQEALKNWYNGLSSTQKDPLGTYHNNDSKPLVKYTAYANIRELLFNTLPEAYGFDSVPAWTADCMSGYTHRIQNGKNYIDTHAPQISQLKLAFTNDRAQHGSQVLYKGELILHAGTEDGQGIIYYTDDGSDPTLLSSQRKQLAPGDSLTIKGNRKVKLVVADGLGNFSAVKTVEAIDELLKYKIARPAQRSAFDESVTFVFPKDKDAAWTTIASFIGELKASGLYTETELRQVIQHALDEIVRRS